MGRRSFYEDKKSQILDVIEHSHRSRGRAPSMREVATTIDVSVATLYGYLERLAEEGMVEWQQKSHRSLRLTQEAKALR